MKGPILYLIVFGMLLTGTINSLLNKFQDFQCIADCDTEHPKHFEQPLIQTLNMFIGEIMCLLVYFFMSRCGPSQSKEVLYTALPTSSDASSPVRGPSPTREPEAINDNGGIEVVPPQPLIINSHHLDGLQEKPQLEGISQLLFILPTLCDLTATTLMNVGLMFISVSIYQMLRGSVVLFTGVFSTVFLGHKHPAYRWFALFVVFLGVAIVGLSSLFKTADPSATATPSSPIGIFLVLFAQAFTGTQFVVEEKIMAVYHIPAIKAVGLEGMFGLIMTLIAIPTLHFTIGRTMAPGPGNVFDMNESLRELLIPQILYAGLGICFSISLFNWCGLAVTQNISATSRSTIDTCRTLFIWMASLAMGWESFLWLQVVGFIVLIYGTFLFNDVVPPPPFAIFQVDPMQYSLVEDVLVEALESSPT